PGDRVSAPGDLGVLVGPAGVPHPSVDRVLHRRDGGRGTTTFGGPHLRGELLSPAIQHFRDAVKHLAPVVGRRAGPAWERFAGGDYRVPYVLARGLRRVGEQLADRAGHRVGPSRLRPREAPADVQLVRLAHAEPVARGPARQGRAPARAGHLRGRSPTPGNRRRVIPGRSG